MASWAQSQYVELPTIAPRLPAMSERIWNATLEPERTLNWFKKSFAHMDSVFNRLISPIKIQTDGLSYPDLEEGRNYEQFWFDDELIITLEAKSAFTIRYSLNESKIKNTSPGYSKPIRLDKTTSFRAKAFTPGGEPFGFSVIRKYEFHPLKARIEGNLVMPLSELWKTKRSWEAPFRDSVQIYLTSGIEGIIRYTMDGSIPSKKADRYKELINVTQTSVITARLFNEEEEAIGET